MERNSLFIIKRGVMADVQGWIIYLLGVDDRGRPMEISLDEDAVLALARLIGAWRRLHPADEDHDSVPPF